MHSCECVLQAWAVYAWRFSAGLHLQLTLAFPGANGPLRDECGISASHLHNTIQTSKPGRKWLLLVNQFPWQGHRTPRWRTRLKCKPLRSDSRRNGFRLWQLSVSALVHLSNPAFINLTVSPDFPLHSLSLSPWITHTVWRSVTNPSLQIPSTWNSLS